MITDNGIRDVLDNLLSGGEVKQFAREIPVSQLHEHIFDNDSRVARNAAWILTHKPANEIRTLPQPPFIDLALTTSDNSLRRLALNLVVQQGIQKDNLRTDLLDYCLQHMMMLDEYPGIQALCLKLAHQMCNYYPELKREFEETLNLMQPENYKPGMRHLIIKTKNAITPCVR